MLCIFVLKPHSEDNKESGEHKEEVSRVQDDEDMHYSFCYCWLSACIWLEIPVMVTPFCV